MFENAIVLVFKTILLRAAMKISTLTLQGAIQSCSDVPASAISSLGQIHSESSSNKQGECNILVFIFYLHWE